MRIGFAFGIATLLVVGGTVTPADAQLVPRYVERNVTAYGCAALGTQKWCTTSEWTFWQYPELPWYLDFSAVFPGKCAYSMGVPLPPSAAGLPDCYSSMHLAIPGLRDWRFSAAGAIRVNTTKGPWYVCEGKTDCSEHPVEFGEVTSIQGSWLGFDTKDHWSQHSWFYTYTVTPEPATMTLFGTGIAGIGAAAWRRRKRRQA